MKHNKVGLLRKEQGVTLIEVLASIVIISIILMGVFSLLIFTNKSAVSNNSKLVSINLAKATIERMKVAPEEFMDMDEIKVKPVPFEEVFNKDNCKPKPNCENLYEHNVNNQTYDVEITVNQTPEEKDLKLVNIVVTISLEKRNINSIVEGYVNYATYGE